MHEVEKHPSNSKLIDRLVDFASLDGTSYRYMQYLAVVAIVAVWVLESYSGVITRWDRSAYPVMTVVLVGGAWVATALPKHVPWVRLVTVATVNAFMVFEVHVNLWFTQPVSMYQLVTTLQWYPLAFGLSYLFLNNRAAMTLTALVLGYELVSFYARTGWAAADLVAPTYLVPLLWNTVISQVMYAALLIAIVHIKQQVRGAREHAQAMAHKAHSDALTGMLNRRGLDDLLSRVGRETMADSMTSIFMMDVDHFKAVNDTFGHSAGDVVLVELAQLISGQIRGLDALGRWGGEEFMVVAPGITGKMAADLGERIRQSVQQHDFAQVGSLTISVGIATLRPDTDVAQTIEQADRALYAAKNGGRNRVVTAAE
jgi:diguanylate cyclase (GGDEF)-like protein